MDTAKRRAYQEKADAELRAWSARIDELLARAEAQKAAGKIELYERLEKLGEQRDSVKEQLVELKESSEQAWDEVREGFEQSIYNLSSAFHSAVDRFPGNPLSSSSEASDSASTSA
jgi:hypothetical protein